MKLICMRGYPGSGKSTIAYSLAMEHKAVVVNRDSLRKMLYDEEHGGRIDERVITNVEYAIVEDLLNSYHDVIVDDTNLNPGVMADWQTTAKDYGAEFSIEDVRTDAGECITRDKLRLLSGKRFVGHAVIENMALRYPMASWPSAEEL